MHRLGTLLAAIFVAAIAATSAFAGSSVAYGIQDDAWLRYGPGTVEERVATLQGLGLDVVRVTVRWDAIEEAQDTFDWAGTDAVLEQLHSAGIDADRHALRDAGVGERQQGPERGSDSRGRLRRFRRRRGRALPLRAPLDDLERAESAPLAVDGLAGAVRDPAPQPRVCGDPRSVALVEGGRRRHRSARRQPAGCPRSRSFAEWGRAAPGSTPTRIIRTRSVPRRRRGAAAAITARRSRWRRSTASSRRR